MSRTPTSWRPGADNTTIKTYWGDARQFVELNQNTKKYDLIFGDAFNDFSVPWHLTTLEFNEKLKKMLTPTGVYMINIIDVYESDAVANEKADGEITICRTKRTNRLRGKRKSAHARGCGLSLRRVCGGLGADRQENFQSRVYFRHR